MHHAVDQHRFKEEGRRDCGPGCQLVTQRCACGLGRRLRVLKGKIVGVEVQLRVAWQWLDVYELLRVGLPYVLCPDCYGVGECSRCRNLGFMERVPRHAGVAAT
jgi:hypothetical protein